MEGFNRFVYTLLLALFMAICFMFIMNSLKEGYAQEREVSYDFCYMCERPNSYVRVVGKDSKQMQEKVYKTYACRVMAKIDYCNSMTDKVGVTRILGTIK